MPHHTNQFGWTRNERSVRAGFAWGCIFLLVAGASVVNYGQELQSPQSPQSPQEPQAPPTKGKQDTKGQDPTGERDPKDPEGLKRLMPKYDVWIDPKRKLVVVQGRVCLRQGALEMFACPNGTKEHESVVALNCKAWHVHAALIAVGAKPIHPVKFDPEYVPAKGTEISIEVLWRDADGNNRRMSAQKWVQDNKGNDLKYPWVFGGSRFYKDEMTGKEMYLAEDGDLICVSNFTTATMDLPIESSADAGGQLFLANTKNIPKLDTAVRLVLRPVLKDHEKNDKAADKKNDPVQEDKPSGGSPDNGKEEPKKASANEGKPAAN